MALRAFSGRSGPADALPRDVRSWEVRTRLDGEQIGTVADVLLDEDGATRYLEVDLTHDDRHVLLPSGHGRADPDEEVVWVPGLARDAFRDVPAYPGEPGAVDVGYERRLAGAYDDIYRTGSFYESPDYGGGWARTRARAERARPSTPTRVDTLDDVDVAEHEHDPRGWAVVGGDGERLGTVEHLMGDTGTMKVRYLTVRLDREVVDEDRRVLIPAGHVALEPEDRRVRVDALSRARLSGFPAWTGGTLEREHERAVTRYLTECYEGERRYRHPRYRQEHLYGASGTRDARSGS